MAGRFLAFSFALAATALSAESASAQVAPAPSAQVAPAPAPSAAGGPTDNVDIQFKNGTTYNGAATVGYPQSGNVSPASEPSSVKFINGKPPSKRYSLILNGPGKITYADGSTLSGTFVNGLMDGPDGEYMKAGSFDYKGSFSKSLPQNGTVTFNNGPVYVGEFGPDGLPGGQGTLTGSGDVKEAKGTWSKGQLTSGSELFANGDEFEGSFGSDGKPDGAGKYSFSSGTTLTGTWQDGQFSGPMVERYRDGTVLTVNVAPPSSALQGKAKLAFADGQKAAGTLAPTGLLEGPGTYTFRNGTQLRGRYHNGILSGPVTRTTPSGHTESGRIEPGSAQAQTPRRFVAAAVPGVFTGPHDSEYTGGYRGHESPADLRGFKGPVDAQGRPNGRGAFALAGGGSLSGTWAHGRLRGPATFTFTNGDRATAKLHDGSLSGPGTYVYAATGFRVDGTYDDGKLKGPATITTPDGDRFVGRIVDGSVQ